MLKNFEGRRKITAMPERIEQATKARKYTPDCGRARSK